MFFLGLALQFLLVASQIPTDVVPDKIYTGKIGEPQILRFTPNIEIYKSSLYNMRFTATSEQDGRSVPVQLIIQDQEAKLFTTLEAPSFYKGEKITNFSEGVICNTTTIAYYDMLPAGTVNATWQFQLTVRNRRLSEDTIFSSRLYDFGEGTASWFYFDVKDGERPLEITLTSDSDILAELVVVPTECPSKYPSRRENPPHLTFTRGARMVLSDVLLPHIAEGRWFFGLTHDGINRTAKDFNISVSYGPTVDSYFEAMIIPPFIGIAAVGLCLATGLLITRTLSTRIGQFSENNLRRRFTWDYSKLAMTVGIVFLTPGAQYISEQVGLMSVSGERDLCYYNELCMRPSTPALGIPAWNNMYSNIGYLIAGFGFIIYIYVFRWFSRRDHITAGLPMNASIPYAMGVAVALEGLASGLYHWCPSRIIFQFDTANMFIIMVLGLSEMWRRSFFRPDGTSVFAFISFVLLLNYGGSLVDVNGHEYARTVFTWIFFAFLNLFFFGFLFPYMMKAEKQRYFDFYSWDGLSEWGSGEIPLGRLALWIILYIVNNGCLLVFNLAFVGDFALSLLAMGTVSLSIVVLAYELHNLKYVFYAPKTYLAMKGIYLSAFMGLWAGALYFYMLDSYNVRVPPSQSRLLNAPCVIGQFYDSHDVWHFLSAMGLFVMCVTIFHLDLNATYKGKRIGEWHWVNQAQDIREVVPADVPGTEDQRRISLDPSYHDHSTSKDEAQLFEGGVGYDAI